MIQRKSQQTTRLATRPSPELQVLNVPAPLSLRSRANGGSPETPLDRTLARAVRQRSGARVHRCLLDPLKANLELPQLLRPRAPLLQRLAVTVQNRTEVAQIKARYLAANPDDHLGWDAVLKAAPSIEALRAQWPAPVVLPTVPQQRAPIVDERPGRAAALTTTDDRGRRIGPFRNPGRQIPPAKGPCYFNDGGDYCISPDRDEHAGADTWKLFKQTATSGRGQGWARVDTLHADGTRMHRG